MPDSLENINPNKGLLKIEGTEIGLSPEEMKAVLDTNGKQFWTDPEIAQIASKTNELNSAIQNEINESRALFGSPEENAESALAKLGVELEQAIDAAETVEPIAGKIQEAISGLQANERVFANKYNTQAYLADLGISVDTNLI